MLHLVGSSILLYLHWRNCNKYIRTGGNVASIGAVHLQNTSIIIIISQTYSLGVVTWITPKIGEFASSASSRAINFYVYSSLWHNASCLLPMEFRAPKAPWTAVFGISLAVFLCVYYLIIRGLLNKALFFKTAFRTSHSVKLSVAESIDRQMMEC